MLFTIQMTGALGYTLESSLFLVFPFLLAFRTNYEKPYIRQIFVQLEKRIFFRPVTEWNEFLS